jgi:hypothetical protein
MDAGIFCEANGSGLANVMLAHYDVVRPGRPNIPGVTAGLK